MEDYYLGMDAGSTYLKAALIQDRNIIGAEVLPTGIDCEKTSAKLLDKICESAGITREKIKVITATGYSRRNIEQADGTISEITAHAWGVKQTAPGTIPPR